MVAIKLVLGLIFLFLGWVYLYNPNLVLDINRIIRDILFNDKQILLARKKLAIVYFFLSFVFLYMGITSLARIMEQTDKTPWLLDKFGYRMYIATQDFYSGRYESAIAKYRILLENSKDPVPILRNMAFAYAAIGNNEKASDLFEKLLKINPNDQIVRLKLKSLREKSVENKRKK
jgi:tetratricopeptide (TPR) repeat protein